MADLVSDVFLSFFCCCFYTPGGGHHGGDTHSHHHHHHYSSSGHPMPVGGASGRSNAGSSSRSRPAVSLQTVELRVRMCCAGCERVVRHALQGLRGVDSVEVDVPTERVSVTGYVDGGRVLREVRRRGKKAEFWPAGATPRRFTSPGSYFRDYNNYREGSYNYRRHGYSDGDRHGRIREPARSAGPLGNLFNDDDVNSACRIM